MIKVELRLFGSLRKYAPDKKIGEASLLELEDDSTIYDILYFFMIPLEETKIILVNGRHSELNNLLHDNDRIAIFPAIAGG